MCYNFFSQLGANVILIARNEEKIKQTFSKLSKGNHIIIVQDITEYDKLEEIVSTAVEKISKISGFVHLAGIEMTLPLRSMSPSDYEKMFAVNLISGFELTKIIYKRNIFSAILIKLLKIIKMYKLAKYVKRKIINYFNLSSTPNL
jgi:NADP-dependent 3-hydroxy acid dehydrogenase YdfG